MPEVQTQMSPEEYLAFERKAESRNELVNGEILPVTGANRIHSLIVVNISGELGRQLEATLCEVYAVKMRVRAPAAGAYLYPDVVAVCEGPRFEDDYFDTLLNPSLVVEVFSKSTGPMIVSPNRPATARLNRLLSTCSFRRTNTEWSNTSNKVMGTGCCRTCVHWTA